MSAKSTQEKSEFAWPLFHSLRPDKPKLVYLDLNHWISFAKAHVGHSDGKIYRPVFLHCLDALKNGKAIFPLSIVHYQEMTKIKDFRQRKDIADVMELLSRFQVLLGLTQIRDVEADTAYARALNIEPIMQSILTPVGLGISYALGGFGEIKIQGPDGDITQQFAKENPELWLEINLKKKGIYFAVPTVKKQKNS